MVAVQSLVEEVTELLPSCGEFIVFSFLIKRGLLPAVINYVHFIRPLDLGEASYHKGLLPLICYHRVGQGGFLRGKIPSPPYLVV